MKRQTNLKYNNFDMTLEECRLVLDNIDGLIITNEAGKIKYMSPSILDRMDKRMGLDKKSQIAGQPVLQLHPTCQIPAFLDSGQRETNTYYFTAGVATVSRIKRVNGEKQGIGALEYDFFVDDYQIRNFLLEIIKLADGGQIDLTESIEEIKKRLSKPEIIKYKMSGIIGKSPAMKAIKEKIFAISNYNSTVLITGETGSGKELIAHAIHDISRRALMDMVEVNCAAIPESLFESEMFGYTDGAFTGAKKGGKAGKFEMAHKSTLFLDEVDQLPYHIQPKLLRVLQEKSIDKIGSRIVPVDVRVIAATNKNLKELVNQGKFREDLYYRLNVVNFDIPPLRERKEDIPEMVQHFIARFNKSLNLNVEGVSDEAMQLFYRYRWPGNVRELSNIIERAMTVCKSDILSQRDFRELADILQRDASYEDYDGSTLEQICMRAEKEAIEKALAFCNGNKTKVAQFLQISRPALYYKIEKYAIDSCQNI